MEGLVAGELAESDRLLVLGGSGWFGRTALNVWRNVPTMATASRARDRFVTWDMRAIRDFEPTVVLNFAFLTPDHESRLGTAQFEATNRSLIDQFSRCADLPSVRVVVTASSGAAIADPHGTYGRLKRFEEVRAGALQRATRSVVVARAYSMSGPLVGQPRAYALSDFVLQARTGSVRVRASRPVWRRYTDVGDFLRVCVQRGLAGWSGTIDSGGELVEMSELASRVVEVVNPRAEILRDPLESSADSVYASDDTSWRAACAATGYAPASLREQIAATDRGLGD